MKLKLNHVKPITLNHCYGYGYKGRKYRKPEYLGLQSEIDYQLVKYKDLIEKFNLKCNEHTVLKIEYAFYYQILTKKKCVSKKSLDIDNIVKPINDIIFNHLNIDDSKVLELNVKKIQSKSEFIVVKIISYDCYENFF